MFWLGFAIGLAGGFCLGLLAYALCLAAALAADTCHSGEIHDESLEIEGGQ